MKPGEFPAGTAGTGKQADREGWNKVIFLDRKNARRPYDLILLYASEAIYARGKVHLGIRVLSIMLLVAFSAIAVYFTGGTYLPYLHIFYVPIILANFLLGALGGLVTAVISGITVGLLPLNVAQHQMQEPLMALFRILFFILVSLMAGITSSLTNRYIDYLQVKIDEKTEELQKNYQELKKLQETKAFLTNTIVHDMKSYLASILVSCGTLRKYYCKDLDNQGTELVTACEASGNRMLNLISNILDVYAGEERGLRLTIISWDPVKDLHKMADLFRVQASSNNVSIEVKMPDDLPALFADRELICRTIENLLYNAIKHTPQGGSIELEAARKGSLLEFRVKNTGSVIPEELREKIFDRFFTAEKGESGKSGTGLGLALCRIAVEAHHGKIWVESRGGENTETTFIFTIPLSREMKNEGK
ncbi:MAG: HAMP domain-containing sensor histidine kinase [Candidatus Eremiobacteraeota bacterium]|nr:HAMP domain-containing sensor histidine kinase [Candidatus Eremiobacteraeota bacterium]